LTTRTVAISTGQFFQLGIRPHPPLSVGKVLDKLRSADAPKKLEDDAA
jgi:hypothetical protein